MAVKYIDERSEQVTRFFRLTRVLTQKAVLDLKDRDCGLRMTCTTHTSIGVIYLKHDPQADWSYLFPFPTRPDLGGETSSIRQDLGACAARSSILRYRRAVYIT